MNPPPLVLGSTSRYRAALLARFGIAFETAASAVDETPRTGEAPAALSQRLAQAKAAAVAAKFANALVIGSDQVAEIDGAAVGKPGDAAGARAQLQCASGRSVGFHTAVCLIDARTGAAQHHLDTTRVVFRALDGAEIDRYIAREQPFDCAGSFKCEGLGISLFDRIETNDPTALVGLPLIALARMLRSAGVALP